VAEAVRLLIETEVGTTSCVSTSVTVDSDVPVAVVSWTSVEVGVMVTTSVSNVMLAGIDEGVTGSMSVTVMDIDDDCSVVLDGSVLLCVLG